MPYLIDGHNLVAQTPGLTLDDPDDEQKLIELLRAYLIRANKKGTVIFDRGLPGGASKWSNNVLEVRFAPLPKTADDVILERVRKARNPGELIVVTGDRELELATRRAGAAVKSSREFAREMLAPPKIPEEKEAGLSPEEIEAWEKAFKERKQG